MKTKILALFIFSVTIFGLFFYYSEYFGVSKQELLEKEDKSEELQKKSEKKVFLEKKKTPSLEKVEKKLTNKQKVKKIREKSKHFKIVDISKNTFYFDIEDKKLALKLAENNFEIGTFPIVLERDIELSKIYGSPKKFLLSLGDKKYIFSKTIGVLERFDFKIPINYIKEDDIYYILNSEKGIFLLDKKSGKIDYAHIFSDFVLTGSNYLAIIQADEKKNLEKYALDKNGKDKIFFYNPISKQKKVVLESNISLEKIYKLSGGIFVENKRGEVFELKNF